MDRDRLQALLEGVQAGQISPAAAAERLRDLPYVDIGHAKLDLHRALCTGFPEVVFCQSKSPEQVAGAMTTLASHHSRVLATRATPAHAEAVLDLVPGAVYHLQGRVIIAAREPLRPSLPGLVAVIAAGTSDIDVAEEAALTAEVNGCQVTRTYDVGVAGLHRLLDHVGLLREASVVIAVAGMEGALPGVVTSLTDRPVIAVPTSIGYGANLGGLSALLGMLTSCSPGLTVTNIDNGFGAAMAAARILRLGWGEVRE